MEVKVTGCIDCPLFDCTGDEYGEYCHHPKRKFSVDVHISNGDGGIKEIEVLENEYDLYDQEVKRLNRRTREERKLEENKKPWKGIAIDNEPIEQDENYNPITPVWCPLHSEPITIIKE